MSDQCPFPQQLCIEPINGCVNGLSFDMTNAGAICTLSNSLTAPQTTTISSPLRQRASNNRSYYPLFSRRKFTVCVKQKRCLFREEKAWDCIVLELLVLNGEFLELYCQLLGSSCVASLYYVQHRNITFRLCK